ncbi:hypothetical protein AB3Y40_02695 [Yoonia sp. R2331]|uniref:hypothetical protein n=1 Tax=Yoonia sp. R2331 TaxID=3237238 RepID=UPI0034E47232
MTRELMLTMMTGSALMLAATQTEAQGRNCGPHGAVTTHLAENYNESRTMMGLAANQMVIEVFVNAETGSWTIIATRPDGVTCLVASGSNADVIPAALLNTDPEA